MRGASERISTQWRKGRRIGGMNGGAVIVRLSPMPICARRPKPSAPSSPQIPLRPQIPGQSHLIALVGASFAGAPNPSRLSCA